MVFVCHIDNQYNSNTWFVDYGYFYIKVKHKYVYIFLQKVKFKGNFKYLKLKKSEWDESKTQKEIYHLLPILDSIWLPLVR